MREKKRRMETFSFYDRSGLERHLARMAEQGWLLEKIGQFCWTYRRVEPRTLTFSVCYFPKASQFDPGPSEEQETFYDFCQYTGWILAAASAQLQVFYNEREDPVPIETDPITELDAIHRTMKRSFLPSQLLLLGVGLINEGMAVHRLLKDPIDMLSSTIALLAMMCWVLMFLLIGVEVIGYLLWHRKAVLAAERGEFLESKSHRSLQNACLAVVTLGLAYYFVSTFVSGNQQMIVIMVVMLCFYGPGLFLLVNGIKGLLKRQKVSASVNRVVTFVGSVVLGVVLITFVTGGIMGASARGWLGGDQETYEYDGRTYTLDRAPLPLALDDLLDGNFDYYTRRRQDEQTFLLGQCTVNQWPIGPVELFPERIYLDYEIILVKAPFLYDLCREAKLHERDGWSSYRDEGRYCYESADPAPWGAEEAYRWIRGDVPSNQFLLFYPERIVEISLDWDGEPAPEQMALVGERLGRGGL